MSSSTLRFEKLLEAVPDALVGMDQKGVIRFVNSQTELLFGYDRDQLIGEHIDMLVPQPLWQVYAEHREGYFADPRTRSSGLDVELKGRHHNGGEFPINISLSHIDTGDVLLVITAAGDVIRQEQAVKSAGLIAAIVECSNDAIIGSTIAGAITSWNPAAERMYGYSSSEVIGKYMSDRLAPKGRTGDMAAVLAKVKAGHQVERLETERVRKDGTVFPVSISIAPVLDDDGAIVGVSTTHRDVTEQRQALETAQRMAAIVENSDEAIIGETLEGVVTSWNPAAARMFGYSSEEIVGMSVDLLIPQEPVGNAKTVITKLIAGQHVQHLETFNLRKDGTVFPISLTVSPIRDNGAVVGASVICRDVTEQRRAFEAAERMAAIVQGSCDAIISRTLEGVITSWNPAAQRIYGYSEDEILGQLFDVLVPEDRVDEIEAILTKIRAGEQVENFETERVRKDGTVVPVSLTVSPIRDQSGEILGASAIAHDMTRQVAAAEVAKRMAAIVESSGDAIISGSLDGLVTSWNPAAERLYGYSSAEMIGRPAKVLTPQDRKGEIRDILEQLTAGQRVANLETTRIRKDGGKLPVALTVSPIRDAHGVIVGTSAIHRDVSELKHAAQYARSLIEAALDPLMTISPEGMITDVNEATVKVTGVPRHDLLGTDFSRYFTDPDKAHQCYQQGLSEGSVTDYPLTVRHRDGTLTDVMYNASVYRDALGNVLGVFAAARDMTSEKEAFESAQRMAAVVEYSDDAIIGTTLEGVITSWNPAAERLFGHPRTRIAGRSVDLLSPRDRTGEITAVLLEISQGRPVDNFETICARKDGTTFPVKLTIAPIRNTNGAVVGASAIARDVSQQRQVLASAQQMAAIVQSSGDAIIGRNLDGIITSWNRAAETMFGYAAREIVGTSIDLLTPPDRAGEAKSVQANLSAGQRVEHLETACVRKDGALVPVSLTVSPIRDAGDTITIGASVICRDMTAQRQAAAATRLAAAIEFSGEAIITTTLEGIITTWNPAAEQLYGYSSQEITGSAATILTPEDRPREVRDIMARISAGERVENYETKRVRKDGTVLPISLTITPIRDADGTIIGATSTPRDITRQKEALAAAQHMAEIVQFSADAIMSQTLPGIVTSWNPAAETMFGYTAQEMIGEPIERLSPEGRAGEISSILAMITSGRPVEHHETMRVRKDGTPINVSLTVSPIRGSDGAISGLSLIAREMNEP